MRERSRFEKELEFVQSLANPYYLQWLYHEGYFKQERFLEFLEYLNYWNGEPYVRFLIYPQSLKILELLKNKEFIRSLGNEDTFILLADQQYSIWKNRK